MNDRGKSDSRVVPAKLANKTGQPAAELVEERRLTKGNTDQHNASRTQSRDVDASSALGRVRRVAQQDRETRFTALLHHVTLDRLRAAYWALNPRAAAGADGVTWGAYGQDLEANLPGSARSGPPRRPPGETIAKGVHTEGGRAASAARHRQLGGQDPPAGRRRGVERRLRGGLPRLLLWFPAQARAQPARRIGC